MSSSLKPCVFLSNRVVAETLALSPVQGKHPLQPFSNQAKDAGVPITILEDNVVVNDAEVHRHEADLWVCLEGEVEFIVGGTLVNPWAKDLGEGKKDDREIKAKEIADGTSYLLGKGDVLWIPAGQPHSHRTTGTARLYVIKVSQPEIDLADVPGWGA